MRRFMCVVLATMLTSFGVVHAQGLVGRWASPNDPSAKTIIAVEKAWAETSCGNSSQPMLRDAVANDFLGTSTHGQRYGKARALEQDNDHDCQLGQVRVHLFGDSLAVVYGSESNMKKGNDGKEVRHCAIWTDTWLKRDGAWQVIAAQDNPLACR